MNLKTTEKKFWESYMATLDKAPTNPSIEVNIPGNDEIADELLDLFLKGKKTAASSLLKDYEISGDPLPKIDRHWIVLNKERQPKCIVKTIRVEKNKFKNVTAEIAKAEGEGDLTLDYWRKAHIEFFTPFLENWGIENLDEEEVITEFYKVVYK